MPALLARALAARALTPAALPAAALGAPAEAVDPLASLDDDFAGTDVLEARGWTIYNDGTIDAQQVSGGVVFLQSTGGGAADAWWYSQPGPFRQDGALVYKLVDGDFDVRARVEVRNAADTGSPTGGVASEWRFAGIAVHDPAGLISGEFNYIHIALGGDPNGANRVEWKVTDDDGAAPQSTFGSAAGSAPLDYDLRIVRVGQTLTLSYRRTDEGEPLGSDLSWSTLETIEKDANTPARTGGATPVAFPSEVAVGIMPPYAGPQTDLDCVLTVDAIRFRTVS